LKKQIKITFSFVLIAILMLNLVGCNKSLTTQSKIYDIEQVNQEIVQGNNKFAFEIFSKLNNGEENNNIFISPISISTALSMTLNGAKGETLNDMLEGLRYENVEIETINNSYKNLISHLNQSDDKIDLNISNSIWYRQGEPINNDFININKDVFRAQVSSLNFSDENSANTINNWIKESTKGKIEKMINPPIPSNVVMYLINAVYFKGEWSNQFKKEDTFKSYFNGINKNIQEVDMMYKQDEIEYFSNMTYKAIRMPYGDEKIAMYVILPTENSDIIELTQTLNEDIFSEIKSSLTPIKDVIINIPKFKVSYGIKELKNQLIEIGMKLPFSPGADFSGIREGIFIDSVLHKAVIEVTEEGSEAAAATVVIMVESSALEPTSFIADKPFIFIIADDETDTILFLGKYCNVE
jgi:serine protease inhibitor